MDSLIIQPTEDSPAVNFDPAANKFMISGESRPENAGKFFAPVLDWINKYESILYWRKNEMAHDPGLKFVFKLNYFNSVSSKYIMDILMTLKSFVDKGYKINVEWHCDKRDDDMLDAGREFSDMVDIVFDFVPY